MRGSYKGIEMVDRAVREAEAEVTKAEFHKRFTRGQKVKGVNGKIKLGQRREYIRSRLPERNRRRGYEKKE